MSLKSIIKASLLIAPTFLVLNHDFFTIRKIYKGRVKGNDFCPTFNPKFESSSSFLEDDYVLVRVLGETYEPKDIKQKFVSVLKADGSSEIKLVECIEGEWCPSPFGFTFVQSGHAWVKTFKDVGDTVPLASIEGVVEKVIWPPDRFGALEDDNVLKIVND